MQPTGAPQQLGIVATKVQQQAFRPRSLHSQWVRRPSDRIILRGKTERKKEGERIRSYVRVGSIKVFFPLSLARHLSLPPSFLRSNEWDSSAERRHSA